MSRRLLITLFLLCPLSTRSDTAPPPKAFVEALADAIYVAEGGAHTRYPYGIKSVHVRDLAEAREITIRSIVNNWKRWHLGVVQGSGGKRTTDGFIEFMAARWIPESVDPVGHRNWVRNVRALLKVAWTT